MKPTAFIIVLLPVATLLAQEADHGIDVRATVTVEGVESKDLTQNPRDGSPVVAGFRSVVYPTWKLGDGWDISGAVQVISRPFFQEDFYTQGYGVRTRIIQLNFRYQHVWRKGYVVLHAGQMPTAFGTFSLRYDDSVNPLVGMPMQYGYYGGVSNTGLTATLADLNWGNWDGRVQLANSSPVNPRSIFEKDQYGNWAGGFGYTIRQGLRLGASAFRGPYLDRESPYFFSGESKPSDLPATAGGLDLQWASGHWSLNAELDRFEFNYHRVPTFREDAAYAEVKRVLHPRVYAAVRAGYLHSTYHSGGETYEFVLAFRPNTRQLVKAGYSLQHDRNEGSLTPVYTFQLVTLLHPISLPWR